MWGIFKYELLKDKEKVNKMDLPNNVYCES